MTYFKQKSNTINFDNLDHTTKLKTYVDEI